MCYNFQSFKFICFEIQLCKDCIIRLDLLSEKFSRMHECTETTTVFIREKRLQMEIAASGAITLRRYFLAHGNSR